MFKENNYGKNRSKKTNKGEKMYSYKKNNSKFKKIIIWISLILSVSVFSILLYSLYLGIDISNTMVGTNQIQTERMSLSIEEAKENNETVSDMIENTQDAIVGISKIKNNGSSIFLADGATQLGIGTGVVVADNGYILTNWL